MRYGENGTRSIDVRKDSKDNLIRDSGSEKEGNKVPMRANHNT